MGGAIMNPSGKINIIMHAYVDEANYNAQNLNAREIALRLNPKKFHITLFYQKNPDRRLIGKTNIHLIKLPPIRYLSTSVILKNLLSEKYDIFFYVRTFYLDYFYFKVKNFFNNKKITIHLIENLLPYPADERYNNIAKANALSSDYVYSVSKYVAETAKKEYGIITPVMYVGVDTSIFTPPKEKKSNSRVRVLYVGSFQKRKRPNLVLESAKYFPDVDFYLIGNGPLKERLYLLKEKLHLKNVNILSNVPLGELIKYYQSADIFLFPSVHEGFPKVTLEAAACGLPGIVFDSYKPETVVNNKTGFIVHDFTEMLEKLETLINDDNLRERMGKHAREYAEKFDWNIIVKKWEKIFFQILS